MWLHQIGSLMTKRPVPFDLPEDGSGLNAGLRKARAVKKKPAQSSANSAQRNPEKAWAASKAKYAERKERVYNTIAKSGEELSALMLRIRLDLCKASANQMLRELAAEGRIKSRKIERSYFWSVA